MNKKTYRLPPLAIDVLNTICLGFVAFWLRYSHLREIYFDIDEAFHLWFASRPTLGQLFGVLRAAAPQQMPLDYLINFQLFHWSHDVNVFRGMSVMWGTGAVVVTYLLGKKIHGRWFGFVWAGLLTISLFHLQMSQIMRPYALIVFLALVAVFCFVHFIENDHWAAPYGAALFVFQAVYPFAVALGALNFYWLWKFFPQRRKSALLATLPSFVFLVFWMFTHRAGLVQQPVFTFTPAQAIGWPRLLRVIFFFSQFSPLSALVYVALASFGVVVAWRSPETRSLASYGLILGFGTLGGILLATLRAHLHLHPRHAIATLPVFLAFAAAGVMALRPRRIGPVFACALMSVLFLRSYANHIRNQNEPRRILNEGAAYLRDQIAPGDAVVFCNPNLGATFLYFYDPTAFFKLDEVYVTYGFNLFRFPKDLQASNGSFDNSFYTLCGLDKPAATMNPAVFRNLRSGNVWGRRFWFVVSDLNYVTEPNPFYPALGLKPENLELKHPGIYVLKM